MKRPSTISKAFAVGRRTWAIKPCKFLPGKGLIDLKLAAESQTYCDELTGKIAACGVQISELSTHLQGQLVAVHPAYDQMFDGFAPEAVHNNPKARTEWAVQQVKWAAQASRRLGIDRHVTFLGALVWPFVYPWPQRPNGLVETGFKELAARAGCPS